MANPTTAIDRPSKPSFSRNNFRMKAETVVYQGDFVVVPVATSTVSAVTAGQAQSALDTSTLSGAFTQSAFASSQYKFVGVSIDTFVNSTSATYSGRTVPVMPIPEMVSTATTQNYAASLWATGAYVGTASTSQGMVVVDRVEHPVVEFDAVTQDKVGSKCYIYNSQKATCTADTNRIFLGIVEEYVDATHARLDPLPGVLAAPA